jgi:mitochondrial fission protein ELM1
LKEVYSCRDVVKVVGEGDLGRLPNRFVRLNKHGSIVRQELGKNAHRNVDDTPNATLSVSFEHGSYLRRVREVASMRIDHCAVPFFVGRVFRKGGSRDLIETSENGRK